MTTELLALSGLLTPLAKLILETLASRKRAQLPEILDNLRSDGSSPSETEALASLKKLKELNLVDEKSSVLPKWNVYLVTSEGLEASRKLLGK